MWSRGPRRWVNLEEGQGIILTECSLYRINEFNISELESSVQQWHKPLFLANGMRQNECGKVRNFFVGGKNCSVAGCLALSLSPPASAIMTTAKDSWHSQSSAPWCFTEVSQVWEVLALKWAPLWLCLKILVEACFIFHLKTTNGYHTFSGPLWWATNNNFWTSNNSCSFMIFSLSLETI